MDSWQQQLIGEDPGLEVVLDRNLLLLVQFFRLQSLHKLFG